MQSAAPTPEELSALYSRRFDSELEYRNAIWDVLVRGFFQAYIGPKDRVLDLGCGYGQFINHIRCGDKFGMDLNSSAPSYLNEDVEFLHQDCSDRWKLPSESLDLVFTSNFFEHLPSKDALSATIRQAARCLRTGGRLVAMGPNFRYVKGSYWDFWDHHVPLTERSLVELLELNGFTMERVEPRFLPYTAVGKPRSPRFAIALYLRVPLLWKLFGGQFLVIAANKGSGRA
jgi:SAM-dependent methyltransferase